MKVKKRTVNKNTFLLPPLGLRSFLGTHFRNVLCAFFNSYCKYHTFFLKKKRIFPLSVFCIHLQLEVVNEHHTIDMSKSYI
jgi:hypothetical protein